MSSFFPSFLSGITFLGMPTEVYQHGSQVWAAALSAIAIALIMAHVTMPVFYKLQVSSSFEYLERRFSKNVRTFSSTLYIVSLFIFVPIVVFVPAIAFSQVTGHNVHLITPIFCIVCITYTSMGGVKAVVWTDTIQFVFTIGSTLAILVLGIKSVGGVSDAWEVAKRGGRVVFFDMDPSPLRRDTFWAQTVGVTTVLLARLGLGQKFVQRYLSIKEEKDLNKAIYLLPLGWGAIQLTCVFTGLLMYAKYHDCDPKLAKHIERYDQILPYYVMDIAGHIPGLPGMFLAGLTSSALATMSASLNTLSGTIYDTLIDRWIPEKPGKEARAANIMKIISVLVGIVTIGLIFVIERLGTIYEMALSIASTVEAPLLGLFLLGMLFPWVGKKGAMVGACASLVVTSWLIIGQQWYISQKIGRYPDLPMSIDGCPNPGLFNVTVTTTSKAFILLASNETRNHTTISDVGHEVTQNEPAAIYRLAVVYFTLIGTITAIFVGLTTSFVVGEMDLSKVDPEHISPAIRRFFPREKFYSRVPTKEAELVTIGQKLDITAKITNNPDLIH
ncbi:hypothetical protein QAD02_019083 [Eretmocerus hayati]|uniref:Uncharacterized protein n=1 Tax=Eretmocerus hayati TaxID=131215 RepID=A0ACC2PKF3_9HYME|nr:hypothetical protein QAD02_019083 [Eretmocerus hayati]